MRGTMSAAVISDVCCWLHRCWRLSHCMSVSSGCLRRQYRCLWGCCRSLSKNVWGMPAGLPRTGRGACLPRALQFFQPQDHLAVAASILVGLAPHAAPPAILPLSPPRFSQAHFLCTRGHPMLQPWQFCTPTLIQDSRHDSFVSLKRHASLWQHCPSR